MVHTNWEPNLSRGFRWNAIWKHMTGDGPLTGLMISQLFHWPLAFTEVHVQPTFLSQTTNVLERYKVSPFSIQNPKGSNLTLMKNGSWSNKSHHLNKLDSTQSSDATYQVSKQSTRWFWRRRFLWGFYHIWSWKPPWPCDLDYLNKLRSHIAKMLHMKFDWNWPSGFWGEVIWKCWQVFNPIDLRSRSVNDLDLWHSQRFMQYLFLNHRVLEKCTVYHFSPFNIPREQIWPWQKWVKVNIGSSFEEI